GPDSLRLRALTQWRPGSAGMFRSLLAGADSAVTVALLHPAGHPAADQAGTPAAPDATSTKRSFRS
ncbi:MAG: hypothetical protein ABJA34_09645, partial [Pseudonocardiales bacterium]